MSRKIVILATGNVGKVKELQKMLGMDFDVLSQSNIGFNIDVEETESTLTGNAVLKAQALYNFVKSNDRYKDAVIVSDDSGLFVDALPEELSEGIDLLGVRTARLSQDVLKREIGDDERDGLNNKILVKLMEGKKNRKAKFETCLCLCKVIDGGIKFFIDNMPLEVAECVKEKGNGFAYDFCLKSTQHNNRFICDLTDEEKNAISHRGKAVKKLINFMKGKTSISD